MELENKKDNNYDIDLINFNKLFLILKKNKKLFLFLFVSIFLFLFFISKVNKKLNKNYIGTFSMLISDPMDEKSGLQKNYTISNFEELAINKTKNDIPTLILLLKSELYLTDIADKYGLSYQNLKNRIDLSVGTIQNSNVRSKFDRAEGIISVKLKTNDKNEDLNLLKDISKSFLKASIEQKQDQLQSGLNFLNSQEPFFKNRVNSIQEKISQFRIDNNLLEPKLDAQLIKDQLKNLNEKLTELEMLKERLLSAKEQILNGELITNSFIEVIGNNTSNGFDGLILSDEGKNTLNEFDLVKRELSIARSKFTKDSKIVKGLQDRIKSLKPLLLNKQINAVNNALKVNQNKIKSKNKQIYLLEKNFKNKPLQIKYYENLMQELRLANSNLKGISAAKESFKLQIAQNSLPWKLINKPNIVLDNDKSRFNDQSIFLIAISLLISYLVIYIKEIFQNKYLDHNEFRSDSKLHILGNIPFLEILDNNKNNNLLEILNDYENNNNLDESDKLVRYGIKEILRNIGVNIINSCKKDNLKKLILLSVISNQGNSTINILLGKTLSELGKKVLLVDLELRNSSLYKYLGLSNNKGFKNIIYENNIDINKITQKVKYCENLYFISGGKSNKSLNELSNSIQFEKFIKIIENNNKYDFILIDSPPLLGSVDSKIISKLVDANILLFNIDMITKDYLKQSLNILKELDVKNIGAIMNGSEDIDNELLTYTDYYIEFNEN